MKNAPTITVDIGINPTIKSVSQWDHSSTLIHMQPILNADRTLKPIAKSTLILVSILFISNYNTREHRCNLKNTKKSMHNRYAALEFRNAMDFARVDSIVMGFRLSKRHEI